ncbi:MAG: hypothetical protein RLZZ241_1216 [Bacteroidota bacterium]|jgi:DNA mismatch repair protein MutL
MRNRIHLLPDHVANQIAAGEVVQRPASVVKELLENAIDSSATRIELIVRDGGKLLVQVVDNGCGMSQADAMLCFKRHATSKISKAEDLFKIQTKGFRGEALASIAAIAQVELQTRTADSDLGIGIRISGEVQGDPEEIVTPVGTSIQVKNLFFNIPARRNFLKSAQVEYRHVLDEFHRVVLVHPSISFRFVHNDSEIFNLSVANLRQRIDQVFGNRMLDKLVPVSEDTQLGIIRGYICKPELSKKSRGEQYFFVNDRFVKSAYFHHAVMSAFEGLLKPDYYPGYFIYFEVPPESIDINIHPTKTEVKFEDEQSLYAILRAAIKHSLGQFSIAPVLDFDADPALDTPYSFKDKDAQFPAVSVDRNFNPFENTAPRSKGGAYNKGGASHWEALYQGLDQHVQETDQQPQWIIESESTQETLFQDGSSDLNVVSGVFQIGRKYIASPIKTGILIVNQQRAYQRIYYEQLLSNLGRHIPATQALLFPIKLTYSPSERHILTVVEDELLGLGFTFVTSAEGEMELTGLPELIPPDFGKAAIDDIIAAWQQHDGVGDFSQADRIAKSLCKSLAVKSGTYLNQAQQQALIHDLFSCKEPDLSPFNKPIHTQLRLDELDKKLNNYG